MGIPVVRAKKVKAGLLFQLLDPQTGQLIDDRWFSEKETEKKSLEYACNAIQTSISLAKDELKSGNLPY